MANILTLAHKKFKKSKKFRIYQKIHSQKFKLSVNCFYNRFQMNQSANNLQFENLLFHF